MKIGTLAVSEQKSLFPTAADIRARMKAMGVHPSSKPCPGCGKRLLYPKKHAAMNATSRYHGDEQICSLCGIAEAGHVDVITEHRKKRGLLP